VVYYNYNIQLTVPRPTLPPSAIEIVTKKAIQYTRLNYMANSDGSWSVDLKGQTRLNVWTRGSGNFRQNEGRTTMNSDVKIKP
jgi:hypothetical protein